MTDPIDRLDRAELIARLIHYNGRLCERGVDPLITMAECFDMRTDRLRQVVKHTIDALVDSIDPLRRS